MKKLIAISMVILLFSMLGMSGVTAAPSTSVTFGVRFDKTEYGVGDTAVATIFVKGLTADITLGGLGTNLSFSSTDFEYVNGTFAEAVAAAAPDESYLGCGVQNGKNIIYLLFVDSVGISVNALSNQATTASEIEIAKLSLTVKKPADSTVALGYEEVSIQDALPYKTDIFDTSGNVFAYSFSAPATAGTKDFALLGDSPQVTQTGVTASPSVCTTTSMMFVAKLYDTNSGTLLAAPFIAFPEVNKKSSYDISFDYSGSLDNVAVTYYFWGTGASILKPIQPPVTFPISE